MGIINSHISYSPWDDEKFFFNEKHLEQYLACMKHYILVYISVQYFIFSSSGSISLLLLFSC